MPTHDRTPYPGLRAFEPQESDLFFGRDGCVDEMLHTLCATKFLAVLGTSGSGKSSLVRTGLFDALELGFLEGQGHKWQIVDMHPGGRPLQNLTNALLPKEAGDLDRNLLHSFLRRGPRSLVQWCEDGNLSEGTGLLLLVDQFEELFRYQDYAGRETAEAFVSLLLESHQSDLPIFIVVTMRSEYLGACALMPGLAEQINKSLYLTRRMTREECREAIEGPAKVCGFEIEPRLVTRVLNDLSSLAPWESESEGNSLSQLAKRADQLPLMQHVLNRLWQSARDRSDDAPTILTYEVYEELGGLRGALDAHANSVVETLLDEWKPALEQVFRSLLLGNNVNDAVRNPRRLSEIIALVEEEATARGIVDAFRSEDCSFLRPPADQPIDSDTIIDFSHESIIRQWSAMEGWLQNEVRSTAVWRRLVSSAEAHAAGEGDLLSGLDLANARDWFEREQPKESWASTKGGDFETANAFLKQSIDVEEKRQASVAAAQLRERTVLRMRAGAYLVAAVLSVGAAIFAFNARHQAVQDREIAETAKDRAERSEALMIQSADHFLIDFASRLQTSIGVPKSDVEELFLNADEFIADLKDSATDTSEIYRIEAALALEKSEYSADRNELDLALVEALAAQTILENAKAENDYTSDDVELLLRTRSQEAWQTFRQGKTDKAREIATTITTALERHQNLIAPERQSYWRAVTLNYSSAFASEEDRWDAALLHAERCLDRLAEAGEGTNSISRVKLSCTSRVLSYAGENDKATPEMVTDLETAITLIDPADRTRGDWSRWVWARNTLAAYWSDQIGDHERARNILEGNVTRMEELAAVEPDDYGWQSELARAVGNVGVTTRKMEDNESAYQSVLQAIDILRPFKDTHDKHPHRAEELQTQVSRAQTYGDALLLRSRDAELPRKLADIALLEHELLEFLVAEGKKPDCEACTLQPISNAIVFLQAALEKGDLGAAEDMFAAYDKLLSLAEPYLDENDMSRSAIIARQNLFNRVHLAFLIPPHGGDAEPIAALTRILEQTERRQDAARKRYPRYQVLHHWHSRTLAQLAKLHMSAGRSEEALAALERGRAPLMRPVALLEADWYRFGNGPHGIDLGEAERLEALIADIPHEGFIVTLTADPLWTAEYDERPFRIVVWGGHDRAKSTLDDIAWLLRYGRGLELSESSLAFLSEEEINAREIDRDFGVHMAKMTMDVDFSSFGNVRASVAAFREALQSRDDPEDFSDASTLLSMPFVNPGHEDVGIAVIRRMLAESDHPLYDDGIEAVLQTVSSVSAARAENTPYSELFGAFLRNAERLIQQELTADLAGLEADELARYFGWRGGALLGTGDANLEYEAIRDLLTSVVLAPDDPLMLATLGRFWAEDDILYPHAHRLLTKAEKTMDPDSEHYAGTLGDLALTTSLTGDPEGALDLIDRAIGVAEDNTSLMQLNRALILHALERQEQALASFDLAVALVPGPYLEDKVDRVRKLLEPFRPQDTETREAVQAMLAEIKGQTLSPRLASADKVGIAIQGYDPVAYHLNDAATKGSPEHYVVWNDAIWLFSNEKNQSPFKESAEDFAPQFGGYEGLHYGAMSDPRVHGSPIIWSLRDDKLYFFEDEEARDEFMELPDETLRSQLLQWQSSAKDGDYQPAPLSHVSTLIEKLQGEKSQ